MLDVGTQGDKDIRTVGSKLRRNSVIAGIGMSMSAPEVHMPVPYCTQVIDL